MTRAFVADASVAIGWVHPAQSTAQTQAMLDAISVGATLEAPAIWPLEITNALTVLVRRQKLTANERRTALGWFRGLPVRIDVEMASLAFSTLADIAFTHDLSVYDAAYLEIAQRRNLPLACHDGPLRRAARRAGVRLWK